MTIFLVHDDVVIENVLRFLKDMSMNGVLIGPGWFETNSRLMTFKRFFQGSVIWLDYKKSLETSCLPEGFSFPPYRGFAVNFDCRHT